jgi:hypothetical protein
MRKEALASHRPSFHSLLVSKLRSLPKRMCQVLILVVLCLTLASIVGQYYRFFAGHSSFLLGVAGKLNLNGEANLPAWYQSSTLLFCALLLALLASVKTFARAPYLWHWRLLSLIFLYLSIDEAVSIHEQAIEPLRSLLHAHGVLYYAWVIPGALFVLGVGLAYLKFLAHLPPRTRWLFVIAGAVFVGGALGIEMVEGAYEDFYGEYMTGARAMIYALILTAEELMEMAGIIIFIYALLDHLQASVQEASLSQSSTEPVVLSRRAA